MSETVTCLIYEAQARNQLKFVIWVGLLKSWLTYPGLKANQRIHFSFTKMFFTAYVLCILRFFKLKTEEQTI